MVNARAISMDCEEYLTFVTKVVQHSDPAVFEKKFTMVKGKAKRDWNLAHRRVVERVPTYSDAVITKIRQVARGAIQTLPIPSALREWYVEVLTILPSSSEASRDVAFGGTTIEVPSRVARLLDELMAQTPGIGVPREIKGLSFKVWNLDNSPNLWRALMDMVKIVGGPPCKFPALFAFNFTLCNQVGRAIFRHKCHWEGIFSVDVAKIMASNAPGRFWYTEEALEAPPNNLGRHGRREPFQCWQTLGLTKQDWFEFMSCPCTNSLSVTPPWWWISVHAFLLSVVPCPPNLLV